jgi:hypothetical protein
VSPARGATALDLLSTLVPPRDERARRAGPAPIMPRRAVAHWCDRCGAPRNLGTRECPGCRLIAAARERLAAYVAREGVPPGGPVELARLADVPLRIVGELMAAGRQYTSRTAR